ncbi:MAG: SAM-dependent methyltransferase [Nitrospirota bacterium]
MNILKQKIIEKINEEGPINFETFMDMALYYPELGYYSSPGKKIGKEGDFYTSPHLHPIFGAMLARQFLEMWLSIGKPSDFSVIEMGAGAGYLCKDIHDYLKRPSSNEELNNNKSVFLNSFRYVIVEPFSHFKEKQIKLLGDLKKNITWITSTDKLAKNIKGCFFSNELFDALPVHIIEMKKEFREIFVNYNGKKFVEEMANLSSEDIAHYIEQYLPDVQQGYRTEINLKAKECLKNMSAVLSNGFIFTIDYGYSNREYYSEERSQGTLLCYHKHQFHENPYQNIGKQDITAHVNFSSLKRWGDEQGLITTGYCPQGTYLTASGIDEVIVELYADSPDYLSEISRIKGLIMPHGMGESHSVMIQYKGKGLPDLRGFSMRNLAINL